MIGDDVRLSFWDKVLCVFGAVWLVLRHGLHGALEEMDRRKLELARMEARLIAERDQILRRRRSWTGRK